MAVSVKHKFESAKADGPDSTVVQPSNWNAEHDLLMGTGKVLGRMTAGTGAAEELPIVVDATGQSMTPPSGTTAERPTGANGMIRYNTTTGQLEAYQNGSWGNFSDIALSSMSAGTVKGRALGSGTGAPTNLTRAQLARLVYNVGTGYPTFNETADDGFIFPFGQNLSRTTYAELYAKWGTTYGAGDGSTTFGCPDLRGRVLVGKDNMGGSTAGRVTTAGSSLDGTVLGAAGGAQNVTLTLGQTPAHTHSGNTGNDTPDHSHGVAWGNQDQDFGIVSGGANHAGTMSTGGASTRHTHPFTTDSQGSGEAHTNMQPSLVVNYQIYTGVHA